jgi:hypothetical protein
METGESDLPAAAGDSHHGIEVGIEFKPVEHPVEPVNLDQPVKCPLPEPSILHVSLFFLFKNNCMFGWCYVVL